MSYRRDLKRFKEFLRDYQFTQLEITSMKDGTLVCLNEIVKNNDDYIGESDKWINVGYSLRGTFPKLLSNLFHYEFKFKGRKLNSIECFFQGIKFKDKKLQKKIFKYSGKEALVLKETTDYNWKETGVIYWMGKQIKRNSLEYDELVIELYVSAIQNKFYRNAIKNCNLPIIHAMGEVDKNKTVFTRYEFEYMLNALHDYLNLKN